MPKGSKLFGKSLLVPLSAACLTLAACGGGGGGGGGGAGTTAAAPALSTSDTAPTAITLDSGGSYTGSYSVASGLEGYLDLPATPTTNKAYGVYISGAAPDMFFGYLSGSTVVQGGIADEKTLTPDKTATSGIASYAGGNWMVFVDGNADTASSFQITVQAATLGGASVSSATAIALGTATWVGGTWTGNWNYFGPFTVSAGQTLSVDLANLTHGVDIKLYDGSGTQLAVTSGVITDRSKSAQFTTLAAGDYFISVTDLGLDTSDAVIGRLTVTAK